MTYIAESITPIGHDGELKPHTKFFDFLLDKWIKVLKIKAGGAMMSAEILL